MREWRALLVSGKYMNIMQYGEMTTGAAWPGMEQHERRRCSQQTNNNTSEERRAKASPAMLNGRVGESLPRRLSRPYNDKRIGDTDEPG